MSTEISDTFTLVDEASNSISAATEDLDFNSLNLLNSGKSQRFAKKLLKTTPFCGLSHILQAARQP